MMTTFARTDTSILGRWWWTVDRWTLAALTALIGIGALLTLAASPAVAERIGLQSFHFVYRQFAFLPLALAVVISVSLLSPRAVRRLAVIVFLVSLMLLALTLIAGPEIKGARRWLVVAGLSVQPSEFVKPAFAVVAAWMFTAQRMDDSFPGNTIAGVLLILVTGLLILQPDLGMAAVVPTIWFGQFFLAGLPLPWVALLALLGLCGLVATYFAFGHVANRIDSFLDPSVGDNYQVTTALEAFNKGGLFGRGPGEGTVKEILPDAHSDFIFAVAGEEFGLFLCLLLVALFALVVLRGFTRVLQQNDLFVLLAASGLLAQFGLQGLINMASTLRLIPTKGMTLPFISYGGSSLLGLALAMGMVLALTRRRVGAGSLL